MTVVLAVWAALMVGVTIAIIRVISESAIHDQSP